jgi:glucokinase
VRPERAIGVDVGGTKILAGHISRDGSIGRRTEVPSPNGSEEELLAALDEVVEGLVEDGVAAVGYGVPSNLDRHTGRALRAVNLPIEDVDFVGRGRERFGLPVGLENDANAAALAEWRLGAGRRTSNLVMLTLGTGVGGGVVIDGMTFRGAHGLGAELGHVTLNPDGPPCPGNCPNRGCLEAYCSGQAIERDATELASDKPDSRLAQSIKDGKVSGPDLVKAAEEGDRDALFIFDNFARMLGVAIAGFVNVFEPERLTIGGGLSRASHLFLDRAVQEADARALPALLRRTRIALAEGGADAGMIGAAVLAAQEVAGPNLRDTALP